MKSKDDVFVSLRFWISLLCLYVSANYFHGLSRLCDNSTCLHESCFKGRVGLTIVYCVISLFAELDATLCSKAHEESYLRTDKLGSTSDMI